MSKGRRKRSTAWLAAAAAVATAAIAGLRLIYDVGWNRSQAAASQTIIHNSVVGTQAVSLGPNAAAKPRRMRKSWFHERGNRENLWTTDDEKNLRWTEASQTFRVVQSNARATHAYASFAELDLSEPWSLELDLFVDSADCSSGLTFGLFGSALKRPEGIGLDFSVGSRPPDISCDRHAISLWKQDKASWKEWEGWQERKWYHARLSYAAKSLDFRLNERDGGRILIDERIPFKNPPIGIARLGISRVHMKNPGPRWESGFGSESTARFQLANVVLDAAVAGP